MDSTLMQLGVGGALCVVVLKVVFDFLAKRHSPEAAIAKIGQDVATMLATQAEQRDRVALFWSKDWPGLRGDISALRDEIRDMANQLDDHGRRLTKVETELHFLLGRNGSTGGFQ